MVVNDAIHRTHTALTRGRRNARLDIGDSSNQGFPKGRGANDTAGPLSFSPLIPRSAVR
jgi:hypothetical protein